MPCGKRPLVKKWDKSRRLRVITPSVLEQTEASVKLHWKNVIRDLELSYKDDQFWETQCNTVRELVGPSIFQKLAKIFKLPLEAKQYEPQSEMSSITPSEMFYINKTSEENQDPLKVTYSMTDYEPSIEEEEELTEDEIKDWSTSTHSPSDVDKPIRSKSVAGKSKSYLFSKSVMSKSVMSKSFSHKKSFSRSFSTRSRNKSMGLMSVIEETASSNDDLIVQASIAVAHKAHQKRIKNPHFEMLYCNESETDMIKWNSKYKQKVFEVSASDEFSKKAEIMTKQICKEFYEWWVGLGNVEFKSEIKRPEDIEDLFQVWFDEHASRGLVLDPKILPCVLPSIANFVGVPKASCPRVLKRQIAFDIHAETSPEHTTAFGTCLPQKIKHIPPKNDTETMWHSVVIPEDLKTMSAVWDDISHLTSTKAFQTWLERRPFLPMPPCLKAQDAGDQKQRFVVPSDFIFRDRSSSSSSTNDLALPVSQFSLELKEVLDKLMNQ